MGKKKGVQKTEKKVIQKTEIQNDPDGETLDEWLVRLRVSADPGMIRQRFPSEPWRIEYLNTIESRSEADVLLLIRSFLIPSGYTHLCDYTYQGLMQAKETHPKYYRKAMAHPFNQRLVRFKEDTTGTEPPPWEGNTWVADLLPDNPKLALQGLEAYMHAYGQHFSDNRIWGLHDVEQLIRAKFIGKPGSNPEALRVIHEAGWRKLECLVERLYFRMGFDTELTPPSNDGGRDVIATRGRPGEKDVVLIDCKLYTHPIEVDEARAILGTMTDARATKGVVVTTSRFTKGAHDFAERNPVELIDGDHLIPLMNTHLGPGWALQVDFLVMEACTPGRHVHHRPE